jgi:hypothetical protein
MRLASRCRAGFSDDDLLRSQHVAEIGSGRALSEQWRLSALAKGGFTDLPPHTERL